MTNAMLNTRVKELQKEVEKLNLDKKECSCHAELMPVEKYIQNVKEKEMKI